MESSLFLAPSPERIGVYLTLLLVTLSMLLLANYIRRKFRSANGKLASLDKEWESAQSDFRDAAAAAREQISHLVPSRGEPPVARAAVEVGSSLRKRVVAMRKKGRSSPEIAGALGLTEAEVDVLIGMARLSSRQK